MKFEQNWLRAFRGEVVLNVNRRMDRLTHGWMTDEK